MTRIYAHRNLNLAKRDWSRWVYSYGSLKGYVGKGKLIGHSDNIVLSDVVDNCQQSALRAIYNGGHRSVSAWLVGATDWPPRDATKFGDVYSLKAGIYRKFSINPKLGPSPQNGKFCFVWADTFEPVQFPLKTVHLTPTGTYAIS